MRKDSKVETGFGIPGTIAALHSLTALKRNHSRLDRNSWTLLSYETPVIPFFPNEPQQEVKKAILYLPPPVLPQHPFQQHTRSKTFFGMTQDIPKREKVKHHISWEKEQCNNKLSIDSSLILHMQHQLVRVKFLLIRLSKVKILPEEAIQTMNEILLGTFAPKLPSKES